VISGFDGFLLFCVGLLLGLVVGYVLIKIEMR